MCIEDLINSIEKTLQQNRQPFFVNATAGTTILGAFDNFNEIADVCAKYNLWMHVDVSICICICSYDFVYKTNLVFSTSQACLGGSIIFSRNHKKCLDGIHRSNSIAWNPHKSLGVPLQCSMFLIKEKGLLHECNSSAAHYLFQQDKFYDVSYDTGDKSIQCGRKVDVFKFWLMLKARGLSGFEQLIDNSINITKYLTNALSTRSGFRLTQSNEFQYTNVCFWYIPKCMRGQDETAAWWQQLYTVAPTIKERMIKRGSMMIGYCPLPSKNQGNFFRMTLACFPPAKEDVVDFLIDEIERLGEEE